MSLYHVALQTVLATAISEVSASRGQRLSYQMVTGITVGSRSVTFRRPEYAKQVSPGTKASVQQLMVPPLMAARLLHFAQVHLVPPGGSYDGTDFSAYLAGYQATPAHGKRGKLQLESRQVGVVSGMHYYVIGNADGAVLQSFIGMDGQRALTVLGYRDVLGVVDIDDLMRIYGATVLARVQTI